jgi:hypothetical protein
MNYYVPPTDYSFAGSKPTMQNDFMQSLNNYGLQAPSTMPSFLNNSYGVDNYDLQGKNWNMPGSGPSDEAGGLWGMFGKLLGGAQKTWGENKGWLIGDKDSPGLLPTGLSLFNAFNQYSAGKAGIKSMKEQNALAREAFNLNKTGMLSDYEDKVKNRAQQDYLTKNPNATAAEVYAAAETPTKEKMKRFE